MKGRKLKWEAPDRGKVKVNCDASFKKGTKEAAIGVIGRNDKGIFLGGIGRGVMANSPFMAECLAAMEAMKYGNLLGCDQVVLETDCQVLFKHLSKLEVKGCEWGSTEVLEECISCWRTLKNWMLSLVAREGNEAADHLAEGALSGTIPQNWLLNPPASLVVILRRDQRYMEQNEGKSGNVSRGDLDIAAGEVMGRLVRGKVTWQMEEVKR